MTARDNGWLTWGLVAVLALAVALLAVWVWPTSRDRPGEPSPALVDDSGPVGAIGQTTAGSTTGAPGFLRPPETSGFSGYTGSTGTGADTAPIGGLDAAYGQGSATWRATGAATGGGRSSGR